MTRGMTGSPNKAEPPAGFVPTYMDKGGNLVIGKAPPKHKNLGTKNHTDGVRGRFRCNGVLSTGDKISPDG